MPSAVFVRTSAVVVSIGVFVVASTITCLARSPSPDASPAPQSPPDAHEESRPPPPSEALPPETLPERPMSTTSRVEVLAHDRVYRGYSFDGHVHTRYSRDAQHGVAQVLELARRAGLDAVMITDHGSSAAKSDVPNYEGPLSVTVGGEFGGTFGHALAWNFVDANAVHAAEPDDLPTLGRIVHERGSLVVLAHPGWWIPGLEVDPRYYLEYDTIRRGGAGETIDAIEIWNGTYPSPTSRLVDSWVALLERSVYVPVVGGSDFHQLAGNAIGEPRNVVLCEVDLDGELVAPLDRCILEAARTGRLYVTDGPSLAFTVSGRVSGEILHAAPGATIRIHARANAAEGGELTIYRGRELLDRATIEPGVPLDRDLEFVVGDEDTFVFADITRPRRASGDTTRSLIANPVRIDVGAAVADWRGPTITDAPVRAPNAFRRRGARQNVQD